MGCNLQDVHIIDADEEHEVATIVELNQDTLTEEGKKEWADVLSAKVVRVYEGSSLSSAVLRQTVSPHRRSQNPWVQRPFSRVQ